MNNGCVSTQPRPMTTNEKPTVQNPSLLALANQLTQRLRAANDQLRAIVGVVKSNEFSPIPVAPDRGDLHGMLCDAMELLPELEKSIEFLGNTVG